MEIWLPIKGYEGIAEVSDQGNVRTVDRVLRTGQKRWGRMMTKMPDKDGYLRVGLNKNHKQRRFQIHRLVAIHFISGVGEQVNHINGIKDDNRAVNLEWCTQSENQKHAYRIGLKSPSPNTRPGRYHSMFKGFVVAKNIETGHEVILEGNTDMVAKGFSQACVSNCLRGKSKAHRGYTFTYLRSPL